MSANLDVQRLWLVPKRSCKETNQQEQPCRRRPNTDSDYCFWHDLETADEAAQARRLGGLRRKREKVVSNIYGLGEFDTVPDLRRVLKVAVLDTMGLDNGVNRNRTLATLVLAGAKLLEIGELEERLNRVEATLAERPKPLKAVGA